MDNFGMDKLTEVNAPGSFTARNGTGPGARRRRRDEAVGGDRGGDRRSALHASCVRASAPGARLDSAAPRSLTTRGMISNRLLSLTNLGAEWVLWLLVLLSVASIGIMIERAAFFLARRLRGGCSLARRLLAGDLTGAAAAVAGREGLEAAVVRAAAENAGKGSQAVREVIAA